MPFFVKFSFLHFMQVLSNKRHPIIEIVEGNLLWIQKRTTNLVPISKKIVQTVAQDIHQKVPKRTQQDP